ncbi:MAG: TonB-dependent receptor [Odoribacter sp.]
MKWGIWFCLLSCQWTLLCAQGQVWTTVKGRIVDDATNEPLAYATIALVKFPLIEDILKGVVTDEEGKFELKTLQGEYTLIIRNLGYRNYVYELTPEMPKVKDLGIIRLKLQPEQLGMVTVKPLVEISADEIKYDLSADPDRETASLHSILDKVPMIHRNPMGNIYVGELGKTFMIVRNGKVDVLFSGNLNDILKALPAKGFSSVTVMLAPPERYGEYDYVVNIETDKNNRLYGAVGIVKGKEEMGSGTVGANTEIVVSLDKLRLSSYGSFFNTNTPLSEQSLYKQVMGETRIFLQQQKNEASGEKWNAGEGFSYDLSKQHFLNGWILYKKEDHRDKSLLNSGYQDEIMTVTNFVKRNSTQSFEGGINYQYDIGETKQVLNIAYLLKSFLTDRWDQGNQSLLCKQTKDEQQEQAFQIHYYNPLHRYWKLELGGGYLYRYYFSENTDELCKPNYEVSSGNRSLMEAHKHIANAYLRINYSRKKFSVRIELKTDYLNDGKGTEIKLPDREEKISETGLNLMPKIGLNWLFPKSIFSRLNVEYSLKHSRPPFRMLSTYEDLSNGDYVLIGNPDLRSQKEHTVRFGTSIKKILLNAGWSYYGDKIGGYWYLDEKERTVYTYGNYGYVSQYFISSNYSYVGKGFNLNAMLGGNYRHSKIIQKEKQDEYSINVSCSAGYIFRNRLNLGGTLGYNDQFQSGYSATQMPAWSLSVWGEMKFFKERVELQVNYADLLRFSRETRQQVNAIDFVMDQRIKQNYIPLTVTLNWRIGSFKIKPVRNIRKSVIIDDTLQE